jgi:hypothetical protein
MRSNSGGFRFLLATLLLVAPKSTPAAEPVLAFGLTNVALGQAELLVDSDDGSYATISNLGSNDLDGVSIMLGQADSGLFLFPGIDDLSGFEGAPVFMDCLTYGAVNGVTNQLISHLRGYRHSNMSYSIDVDFTPVQPSRLVFEIYYGKTLLKKFTSDSAQAQISIDGEYSDSPRVNPFWRRLDGRVGMLLEVNYSVYFGSPPAIRELRFRAIGSSSVWKEPPIKSIMCRGPTCWAAVVWPGFI